MLVWTSNCEDKDIPSRTLYSLTATSYQLSATGKLDVETYSTAPNEKMMMLVARVKKVGEVKKWTETNSPNTHPASFLSSLHRAYFQAAGVNFPSAIYIPSYGKTPPTLAHHILASSNGNHDPFFQPSPISPLNRHSNFWVYK